jgi:hypothetical protein
MHGKIKSINLEGIGVLTYIHKEKEAAFTLSLNKQWPGQ